MTIASRVCDLGHADHAAIELRNSAKDCTPEHRPEAALHTHGLLADRQHRACPNRFYRFDVRHRTRPKLERYGAWHSYAQQARTLGGN